METRTRVALLESIEKWRKNTKAKTPEDYLILSEDCPLCHLFIIPNGTCDRCPIDTATKRNRCETTPWTWAYRSLNRWADGISTKEIAHTAAVDEMVFLQSLVEAR